MITQAAGAGNGDDRCRSFGDSSRFGRFCELASRTLTIAMTLVCPHVLAGAEERPVATVLVDSEQPLEVALSDVLHASVSGPGMLSLEEVTPPSCHSSQVDVELWMRVAPLNTAGFNAFVEFDEAMLSFASGSYTGTPFSLHISDPITATAGEIDLDGSIGFGESGVSGDALLATLGRNGPRIRRLHRSMRQPVARVRFGTTISPSGSPSRLLWGR